MFNQRNAFQNNTPCQTENGSQSAMKNKECRKESENVTKRCRMEEKHKKNYEDVFFLSFLFLHPEFQGFCKFDNYTTGKELTGNYCNLL